VPLGCMLGRAEFQAKSIMRLSCISRRNGKGQSWCLCPLVTYLDAEHHPIKPLWNICIKFIEKTSQQHFEDDNQPTQCFNSNIQGGLNKGFQQIVESFFVFNPIAPQVQIWKESSPFFNGSCVNCLVFCSHSQIYQGQASTPAVLVVLLHAAEQPWKQPKFPIFL
jgi:hypothetical protein